MDLTVPDHGLPIWSSTSTSTASELDQNPHRSVVELLQAKKMSPIYFTPRSGDHWIVADAGTPSI